MRNSILTLLVWVLPFSLFASDPEGLFSAANTAYQEGDFTRASEMYQQIIDSGYVSAELYYNLGNACFRDHRLADAILNYERAGLLDPRDPDIAFNLELVNAYVKDKIEVLPPPFYIRWFQSMVQALPPDSWGWISLLSFVAAFLLFSVFLYVNRRGIRKAAFWISVLLFLVSFSSFVSARSHYVRIYGHSSAIVYEPSVTVKSTPDESGTDLFILHEGTKVNLGEELGEWTEIRIPDGNKGWIRKEVIRSI